MPHKVIIEDCTACAGCESECPVGAATLHEGGTYYIIDIEKCTDCGDCVQVCPVEAIVVVEGG